MPLTPGVRIGVYEVLAPLGVGGMGEVYRARDTRLQREVALKVLPESVIYEPMRVARFTREAQLLASLNHPNIGGIHGVEDGQGTTALVLELVEGPTLADRIAEGPLPVEEAIPIARQILDALEAAHDIGIIHRDLKPANIKVRRDGTVKVLDFGLAKALDPAASSSANLSQSPTLTTSAWTRVGMIVGTAAYMSPEQAAGKALDRRSDLWSFGIVLLEMLTGRPVFVGETASHVLAAVLREEPDFTALPPNTPPAVRRLLRRCLEKNPKRRLDSAAAARLELDEAETPTRVEETPAPAGSRRIFLLVSAAALAGALIAGAAVWTLRRLPPAAPPQIARFTITPPSDLPLRLSLQAAARDFAVAPDGSFIVYRATGGQLALRRLDQLETTPIVDAATAVMPFVSPDSRWIGFVQDDLTLKKVAVSGGASITLARLPVWPRGASWIDDNTIVIGTNSPTTGLIRVPAGGGEPVVLTTPDRTRGEEGHLLPFGLPGGRAVLFTVGAADPKNSELAVLDLQTGQRTSILRGGRDAQYLSSGHLIYQTGLGMSAVRFDVSKRSVVGEPVRLLDNLALAPTAALNVTASTAGTLIYVPAVTGAAEPRTLAWVDRNGRETPIGAPSRPYESARISPDGENVVVSIRDQQNDLWMWSLARQTLTRLTFDADVDLSPVWAPDGRRVIFSSARAGVYNLYSLDINQPGSDTRLTSSANTQLPDSVTSDGAYIIAHEVRPQTKSDIGRFTLQSGATKGTASEESLIQGPFEEWNGEVSPDGHLLAYQSVESGTVDIYVSPYPDVSGGRWQVSSGGGHSPVWTRSGRELIYLDGSNRLNAVSVQRTDRQVQALSRTTISPATYAAPAPWRAYDVSPDGQRFLAMKQDAVVHEAASAQLIVVQNWFEELHRVLPAQ